ncbi:MAG TPA: VOC family protein [Myxococcaceae bacterium]|nr:VOC family protein [Myxococcaceae bacterium]
MIDEELEFISAVLLVSPDPARLATFYRDVLGVPLREDKSSASPTWACRLGDLYFTIHSVDQFPEDPLAGIGAVRLAFNVFDVDQFARKLIARGAGLTFPPKDMGWCRMTALRDPDGNVVQFTQPKPQWYEQLADRKKRGFDLVLRWKAVKALPRPSARVPELEEKEPA